MQSTSMNGADGRRSSAWHPPRMRVTVISFRVPANAATFDRCQS
jgi:hypothetical protein